MVQQFDSFPRRIKVPKSRVTKEKESNQMPGATVFWVPQSRSEETRRISENFE